MRLYADILPKVGSPHHDQTLVEETPQNGDDDEESEDFEIVYEEVELEEEPDPLEELMQLLRRQS